MVLYGYNVDGTILQPHLLLTTRGSNNFLFFFWGGGIFLLLFCFLKSKFASSFPSHM